MCEKRNILLKNRGILSDQLISQIDSFFDYEKSDKIRVAVVSCEEKLKAKSCSVFAAKTNYLVEGYSLEQSDVELKDLLYFDYIIIHTAAIRMAPLKLTETLRVMRQFNKKTFVIIDKWNLLPQSKKNVIKVKKHARTDFSMLNVIDVFNVGENETFGFLSIENIVEKIIQCIEPDFLQVRQQQIDKIYNYYLDTVQQECVVVKGNANEVIGKIEKYIVDFNGFRCANIVKIKGACSGFSSYSVELLKKWELISVEECAGEVECEENEEFRQHIKKEYVTYTTSCYKELTDIVKEDYQRKLQTLREKILNEAYQIRDKISRLKFIDEQLFDEFTTDINNLNSIDTIMSEIIVLLDDNVKELEKRVSTISNNVFDEEILEESLEKRLKELMENFDLKEEQGDIRQKIKKESAIRKYYDGIFKKCNLVLFSEVDQFIGELKKSINKKSSTILDLYYVKLEKKLLEMETEVERNYVVV